MYSFGEQEDETQVERATAPPGAAAQASASPPPATSEDKEAVDWSAVALPFLFPALGGLLFGYDIGATSGAVVSLKDAQLSGTDWYDLSATATGLVVSGSLAGALAGSALAFVIADLIGRRRELMAAAGLYCGGAALMATATSLPALVAGRVVYGLAIGLTAPSSVRGTLISLKEVLIVVGILLGYLAGSVEISQVGGWRYMFGAAAPLAVVMAAGVFWLPPSPRWLLLRAGQEKGSAAKESLQACAVAALRRLRGAGAGGPASSSRRDAAVEREIRDMLATQEQTEPAATGSGTGSETALGSGSGSGYLELVQGANLKALVIGCGLVTGQPSVLYYAAPILQDAGFAAAADATRVAVLLGGFKLLMTGVAVVTVDKWGRRPLLLTGISGLVASLFLLATFYLTGSTMPALSVGSLLLYVGCYQVSFGPISWLMVSEVFPLRIRGRALGVATLVNFGSNALVAFALPPIQDTLGQAGTFITFGLIGVSSLAFVALKVPETKGLSLEEIEAKLQE
eukprot:jgi/Mesen1/10839/ME000093S10358